MIPPEQAPKTLLMVEDNEVTREGLVAVLWDAGYGVVSAGNGAEALRLLRDGPRPDLILLDMLLPVLDSWHFLKRLQQLAPQPPIPIIVATATILTREWAADHGCQGFLHKLFSTDALLEEVRRCLGQRPAPRPDPPDSADHPTILA
jgi:CheY-like chemotaxis protein